jgi:hypothetical protein
MKLLFQIQFRCLPASMIRWLIGHHKPAAPTARPVYVRLLLDTCPPCALVCFYPFGVAPSFEYLPRAFLFLAPSFFCRAIFHRESGITLSILFSRTSIPSSPLSYLPSRYLYHTPIEHIQVPISRSYSQGFGTTENLMYRARGLLDSKTSIISHHNFEREKSSYSSDSIRTDYSQNFLEPLLYESTNGILTSRKRIVPSVVLVSRVGGERIHIPYARQMREVVLTGLEGRMSR